MMSKNASVLNKTFSVGAFNSNSVHVSKTKKCFSISDLVRKKCDSWNGLVTQHAM